jgi:hypothetical protein
LLGFLYFISPDFPHTWSLLSPEMKHVANRRMAIDAAEADLDDGSAITQFEGAKMAFTDVKTYLLAFMYMAINASGGFQNFFPTLTATLGYNHVTSLLLVAPPYIFMVFYSIAHNYMSDRMSNRFWFIIYPIPIAIVGFVIFMTAIAFGPHYFSIFLMTFVFAQYGTVYGWVASSIPRSPAKRAVAFAFINAFGNTAPIWTSFTYNDTQKPFYRLALGVCVALQLIGGLLALALELHLRVLNKRLTRLEEVETILTEKELKSLQRTAEVQGIDITTARNLQKGFRYQL